MPHLKCFFSLIFRPHSESALEGLFLNHPGGMESHEEPKVWEVISETCLCIKLELELDRNSKGLTSGAIIYVLTLKAGDHGFDPWKCKKNIILQESVIILPFSRLGWAGLDGSYSSLITQHDAS